MKTILFGCNGQLGKDLGIVFGELGEVWGGDLPGFDIANGDAVDVIVRDFSPDILINAAAYTNVDRAEDDVENAFLVNDTGARNVARAAGGIGVPVVFYSTDYVFGGKKTTPYLPDDEIAPIGVYARSKSAGEIATREENPKHYILRTAWLYGPGGNNFVEKIIAAANSRPELKVVDDEIGSPTHTLDLARATAALFKSDSYGTYHAVNTGSCSRFEYACEILRLADIDTPISPCISEEFETKAERPLYSVLSTDALESVTGQKMQSWQDALKDYMSRRKTASIR